MTTLRLREHPAARDELLEALDWYDEREIGLGRQFLTAINADLLLIRTWPEAAPKYRRRGSHSGLRSKNLDVFPYRIIYFVRDAELIVVAYAPARRRPDSVNAVRLHARPTCSLPSS